ncbi:chemotaxis protein CheW [bacterium]|jgi:chemotaxis-related protein WspD|nr:chemotaxis protein CheW [bacterium]
MTESVRIQNGETDCWTRIGVWGDRSCPILAEVVHCQNCTVFGDASRRFLQASCPEGYLEEWTERLSAPMNESESDFQTVLVFRIGEEWLALRVEVLVEVATLRPVHRVPHRGGLLAGLVNIRGELQLCVRLDQALGMRKEVAGATDASATTLARLLVLQSEGDRWVFPVDEVDEVFRFPKSELGTAPATLARSSGRHTQGVFYSRKRSIGFLDDQRLFQTLRGKVR